MVSLFKHVLIDEAENAHFCRANSIHRISRGERRLALKRWHTWEHYCIPCALKILQDNIAELQRMQQVLMEPQRDVIRL
jgi:hypothetical protein